MRNKARTSVMTGAVLALTLTAAVGCGSATSSNKTTANTTAASIPAATKYSGPVVATYQGGTVTKQELDQQYNLQIALPGQAAEESKSQFAPYYIVWYKYIYQQAEKQVKNKPTAAQATQLTDQAMTQMAQSSTYGSMAKLQAKMKSLGVTKNDLIRYFANYTLLQSYLQQQVKSVKVSNADLQTYYNQHKTDYVQVTVDQILLNSKSQAQSVENQLKAKSGTNFAALADKYSKDTSVTQNHGHLANQLVSVFVPQFAAACRTLPLGQISDPVHTQYGYHILRVDARKQLTFSEAKSDIEQQLLPQAQQNQEVKIYQDAKKAAAVKITAKGGQL